MYIDLALYIAIVILVGVCVYQNHKHRKFREQMEKKFEDLTRVKRNLNFYNDNSIEALFNVCRYTGQLKERRFR